MPKRTVQQLLARGPNWLGDAVMCEPALKGLRRLFPQASITLLVKPLVAELFESHPAIDRIFLYEDKGRHAGPAGKWRLARDLRREGFDLAVLFQNAFEAALLTTLAGIRRRYGYATDGRSFLLSEPVMTPDRRAPVHQVDYYWNMLAPLGLAGHPGQPELFLSPDEERSMAERLARVGITADDVVIGINPGSTYGGAKRWFPDRFAESTERLCRRVSDDGRRPAVVVIGAKGEEPLGREIASRLSVCSVVLSGATTIRELMAVVKRCALLVTNDTGPMHIASALRVPVVAVFGPTDWRSTSPCGEDHALLRHPVDCAPCMLRECPIDHRCMTGVTVEQVYAAGIKLIHRSSGVSGSSRASDVNQTNQINQTNILDGYTVFLDRDGTLNEDPGYLKSPSELKLLPGVAMALARLKFAGARLVVVTNQSGVARGFLSLKDLEAIHARLEGLLEQSDAALDAIYFCPHHPDDGCRCRKPATGMVDRAVSELQVDLGKAYLIGDHASDIKLANAVGITSVLVTSGRVDQQAVDMLRADGAMPDTVTASMTEAVDWILHDAAHRPRATSERRPADSARTH
ncbi:MAG TPA: lipopolysaccharide heptosyltransferase II [Nitrospira sp.]|nr:lipopolysaccharide heptosyltransferase II [Nitrospira sp.]